MSQMILAAAILTGTVGGTAATGNEAHASEDVKVKTSAGSISKENSSNDTSKPIDFNKAQSMSPKERVEALTEKDKKLHDKEENDGPIRTQEQGSLTNVNINKYIAQKGFKPAKITEEARIGSLPKYSYKSGKYVGVVVHETANPNSNIYGEINYMYGHYYNAFVHAFVDGNRIIQTAPADYLAWGAGPGGNPYFYQVELVRAHSVDEFARSVNNDAYLTAYMLKRNGLKPILADNNGGRGTVISHNAVSRYYGGSDHTDPYSYFSMWNYDMNKYFELVKKHYANLTGTSVSQGQDNTQSPIKTATYKVQHGDTLYDIAKRSGTSINNIKKWSNLKSNVLYSGQVLRVKAPTSKITTATYTVKHGDTLYDVSKRSGVSMSNIKKWSNISSNVLHTGQVLQLKAPAPKKVQTSDKITSKSYQISKGDTLYSISKRSGVSVNNIKKYNNLKSNNIVVGQTLYLAPTHTVQKGETLYRIAKNNNLSVSKLKTLNGLKSNTIKVGQKLLLK